MKRYWGFLLVSLAIFPSVVLATTDWEVAILILGKKETNELQNTDADRNVLEIGYSLRGAHYRLSLYREFSDRNVAYFPDPKSTIENPLDKLMFKPLPQPVVIAGELEENKEFEPIFSDEGQGEDFFNKAYRNPKSNRLLVIYTHGFAFQGLHDIEVKDLAESLKAKLPKRTGKSPLDILWLDACFMANLETAYQLRDIAPLLMGSEESEFSSGAAFDQLKVLADGPDDPKALAMELAQGFLDSYSYSKNGSQRGVVLKSSATLSVIETKKLPKLVEGLGKFANELKPFSAEEKSSLKRGMSRLNIEMEDKRYIMDLGSFLTYLQDRREKLRSEKAREQLNGLLTLLERSRAGQKTNTRIRLQPAEPNQRLVFGYDDWKKGWEGDEVTFERIPRELKLTSADFLFVGKRGTGKRWPSRVINKRIYVEPFGPDLHKFHFYFADVTNPLKVLSPVQTIERTDKEVVTVLAKNPDNPVLFSGYTQGVGSMAEKYTGLNVLNPFKGEVPPDYLYLDYSELTRWEELAD